MLPATLAQTPASATRRLYGFGPILESPETSKIRLRSSLPPFPLTLVFLEAGRAAIAGRAASVVSTMARVIARWRQP